MKETASIWEYKNTNNAKKMVKTGMEQIGAILLKSASKRLLNFNRLVHEVMVTANFANLSDISKLDGYVVIALIDKSSGVKSSTRIMKSYSQNKNAFQ